MGRPLKDIAGKRFGRLLVISPNYEVGKDEVKWLCICECGKYHTVKYKVLSCGGSKSCGCLRGEGNKESVTHGQSRHRANGRTTEYIIWTGIKGRCLNKNNKDYKHYGGRGISVCERWMAFENFFSDMGKRPSSIHSIDRIENEGNYEKGNCRWATATLQANNRRTPMRKKREGE